MPQKPHKILIDCDPGIDDALALLLAIASPQIDVLAVTTVAGNRDLMTTSRNARDIMNFGGRSDIPVFAGAETPLNEQEAKGTHVHGKDGLGGVDLGQPPTPNPALSSRRACLEILEQLDKNDDDSVTIVAIGPLTNLAMALALDPKTMRRARNIVIMGGALFCPANVTEAAEFNILSDPLAAHVVLESGLPVTLFPLDLTCQVVARPEWLTKLSKSVPRFGPPLARMLTAYTSVDPKLHDPCPVAWLAMPHLFTIRTTGVEVVWRGGPDQGRTRALPKDEAKSCIQYAETAQDEEILSWMLETLLRLG